jgi:hypothetical protein
MISERCMYGVLAANSFRLFVIRNLGHLGIRVSRAPVQSLIYNRDTIKMPAPLIPVVKSFESVFFEGRRWKGQMIAAREYLHAYHKNALI